MTVLHKDHEKKVLSVKKKHLFYFNVFYLHTIDLMSNASYSRKRLRTIPNQCKSILKPLRNGKKKYFKTSTKSVEDKAET